MTTNMDYTEAIDLKRAKTRCWGIWLGHVFAAPIASVVYSAKTQNWLPFWAATGVFAVTVPIALVDVGITMSIAPPLTSALMLQSKVQESRRKRGIFLPEEAEAALYNGLRVKDT